MKQSIGLLALVVRDYDEAIRMLLARAVGPVQSARVGDQTGR